MATCPWRFYPQWVEVGPSLPVWDRRFAGDLGCTVFSAPGACSAVGTDSWAGRPQGHLWRRGLWDMWSNGFGGLRSVWTLSGHVDLLITVKIKNDICLGWNIMWPWTTKPCTFSENKLRFPLILFFFFLIKIGQYLVLLELFNVWIICSLKTII